MAHLVPDELDGQRLDVVVAALTGASRSQSAARVAAGEVHLDGRAAGKQQRVRAGQRIDIAEPATAVASGPPPAMPPVRFEDEHLLVVSKPAGMVVHPGHGQPDGTLVDALLADGTPLAPAGGEGRPGIVHRLDRGTSGLLVVAKTDRVHAALVDALRRRAVSRRYVAVAQGRPRARRGRIEAPLGRDPSDRLRFAVREDGKPAVTRYVVLDDADLGDGRTVSLLACALETGRTHQIRVHLSALGHPIVADLTYRASPGVAEQVGATRIVLHAGRLAFHHPVTGDEVAVVEPLPGDLDGILARTGLALPDDWWRRLDDAGGRGEEDPS